MRIFIAFGYNDRDKWIREMVFPLISAFGDEVETGEVIYGNALTEGVKQQLRDSQAIIAFLTRRADSQGALTASTHWWVLQELAIADTHGLLVLPVREEGLEPQQGIGVNYQWIDYKPAQRDLCIVEIVKALGKWHSATSVRLQLLPDECAAQLRPMLRKPDLRVRYQLLINGEEGNLTDTKVVPIKGGLFVDLRNVPRDALLRLHVGCQGQSWTSDYESMDSVGIKLAKEE
jgi:hypothetical protein